MQETLVQSLVQEDPTCLGTTKPVCHNFWACALQQEKLLQWEADAPQLEEVQAWQQRPSAALNK